MQLLMVTVTSVSCLSTNIDVDSADEIDGNCLQAVGDDCDGDQRDCKIRHVA